MHNIIVKTTFKNNLELLKPFYNFYKSVWNPKTFVFLVGCTEGIPIELAKISKLMRYKLDMRKKLGDIKFASGITLYQYGNMMYILYNTKKHYSSARVWDKLRGDLFRYIEKHINPKDSYERTLSVDNDDFFYVKNVSETIKKSKIYFHALEFLPPLKLKKGEKFQFISTRYYYTFKANRGKIHPSHGLCSELTWPIFSNVGHAIKTKELQSSCLEKLSKFEKHNAVKLSEMDGFSFSFGCLDLDYLIRSKHWLQSMRQNDGQVTMTHKLSRKDIEKEFKTNFILTEEEKSTNIIFEVSGFEEFFF